jgi:phosphoserine phosphatase
MEQTMSTLDEIKSVTSTSQNSVSMVVLEFEESVNMDSISVDIQQKISALQGSWDDTIGAPYVLKINPSMLPVQVAAVAYEGLTPAELEAYVENFKGSAAEGFDGMTRGEAWYKPMVELVSYLQDNDFEVYIVTATERNVVRGIVDGVLDIAPSHVIGTEYGYVSTGQGEEEDGDYTFQTGDKVVFDGSYAGENAKMNKVDAIVREIGQQPVLAFGNSSGDVAMMEYVISDNPYKSASFMVLDDDATRDHGDPEEAASKTSEYEELGFTTISMANDFATIYGDDVEIEQK